MMVTLLSYRMDVSSFRKPQRKVADDVAASEEQQRRLRARLHECLEACGVQEDPDEAWLRFEEDFLTPLVTELGARTYELLIPDTQSASGQATLPQIIGRVNETYSDDFRRAIVDLLDPSDSDVRAYVLRALNAHFFAEASSISSDVLGALGASRARNTELKILLDTNFVFSILRLHDNPLNEVAEALDDLISRVRESLGIKLHVLPITVDEARAVLQWHMNQLSGVRPPPNVARAVAGRRNLAGLPRDTFWPQHKQNAF